jgi:hypothetical protein
MNELDRDVLRIGSVRAAPECQQSPSSKETVGHFAAGRGEPIGLACKEPLKDRVSLEKLLFYGGRQIAHPYHRTAPI